MFLSSCWALESISSDRTPPPRPLCNSPPPLQKRPVPRITAPLLSMFLLLSASLPGCLLLLFTVIDGCCWAMIVPHAPMIRDPAGLPCKMSAPQWQGQTDKGKYSPGISALLRNRVGGMCFRLPALLLLPIALHMLPTGSTHPWEAEIRKLAEPAAGEPAACMSHQAQLSTAARAKDNF